MHQVLVIALGVFAGLWLFSVRGRAAPVVRATGRAASSLADLMGSVLGVIALTMPAVLAGWAGWDNLALAYVLAWLAAIAVGFVRFFVRLVVLTHRNWFGRRPLRGELILPPGRR